MGPTYPIRGGISHYTTLLAEALRRDHAVLFVSYLKQYPDFLFPGRTQRDQSESPISTECERLISFSDPRSWRAAARRITDFGPDVLLVSWVNPALSVQFRYVTGYVKRRLPATKVLFWCHNVAQHERLPLNTLLTRFAFRRADGFIVTGRDSEKDLRRLKKDPHVEVAYLPTLDSFGGGEVEPDTVKAGLEPGEGTVLYFGFVRAYKGLSHLIDAMPMALERVPGLRLLVVGEFWDDRAPYDRAIARHGLEGKVLVVDRYVPNEMVAAYFRAADLVVLPYVSATGSGIVQVAYGFGRPVLTTRVGSLPEVVEDGRTGYLVPPGDPAAIAGAMIDFFERGRARELSRNVEAFRERFSWDRMVEAVESLARAAGGPPAAGSGLPGRGTLG